MGQEKIVNRWKYPNIWLLPFCSLSSLSTTLEGSLAALGIEETRESWRDWIRVSTWGRRWMLGHWSITFRNILGKGSLNLNLWCITIIRQSVICSHLNYATSAQFSWKLDQWEPTSFPFLDGLSNPWQRQEFIDAEFVSLLRCECTGGGMSGGVTQSSIMFALPVPLGLVRERGKWER